MLRKIILSFLFFQSSVLLAGKQPIHPIAAGKVMLSKDLVQKAKGIKTLFIVVYDEASKRPMPFGATKVMLEKDANSEVHSFTLDTSNVRQMGHGPLPKTMRLKARLDKDGSAGMDSAGDLMGDIKGVKLGAKDVVITIDQAK